MFTAALVHTVFSPDLECEYTNEVHDPTCPEGVHRHFQARAHPGHALNHPEIELSLLTIPDRSSTAEAGVTVAELPVVETCNGSTGHHGCFVATWHLAYHSVSLHRTPSACSSLPIPLIHFLVS